MLIKEYIITSPKTMAVSVFVGYDQDTKVLRTIRFEGAGPKAIHAFGKSMPYSTLRLHELAKELGWKLEELAQDLSFDRFYEEYGNKVGKKQATNVWGRMTKENKVKALIYIDRYKNLLKLRPGQQQMYPATYLNSEPWND